MKKCFLVWFFSSFYFCFQSSVGCILLTSRLHPNPSIIKWKKEKHEAFSYSLFPESRKNGITVCFLPPFSICVDLMAFKGQQGRPERAGKWSVPASLGTPKGEYPSWFLSLSEMKQSEKKEPYIFLRHFSQFSLVNWKHYESSSSCGGLPVAPKCKWH